MKDFYAFFLDTTTIALQSIFANKLRAFLTLIGIIIGVASVVVVGALIGGLNSYVLETVTKIFGVDHFMITRIVLQDHMTDEEIEKMIRRNKPLEWAAFQSLEANCSSCTEVGAKMTAMVSLQENGTELRNTIVEGVTANMIDIEDKKIAEGRFLMPHEVEHAELVCVIGMEIMEKIFQGADPVGQALKVRGKPLLIIGVEEKRGTMFGQSLDRNIYIPLTTFGKMFGRHEGLELHGKAAGREQLGSAIDDARTAIRNHHRLRGNEEDDFGVTSADQLNNQVDEFTNSIALVVTPITLISLLVGGIVVMNIMLVTVTERSCEIGLRKAVGAKRRHILAQFLIESAMLTALGGVLGLLISEAFSALISATTTVPMTITASDILLSLLVSGGIGLIAGIYPAYKAAKLDPVIALAKN